MTKNSEYTRELSNHELKSIKTKYNSHLTKRGFLSPNQKKRILGMKNKERGTPDSDFWHKVRNHAKNAIMDLELISEICSDDVLEDIFRDLRKEDHVKRDKGEYSRTTISHVLSRLFRMNKKINDYPEWKNILCAKIIEESTYYLRNNPKFKTRLHERLFDDILDTVLMDSRDSTQSSFA